VPSADSQNSGRPFLITIDTEGDNLWAQPREITTRNVNYLPRFQALCERHGFCPTWLTNFEMATAPAFVEFGRDVLNRGAGEIGMHLHAWNSPPLSPLTNDDYRYQPFLFEYPRTVIRAKVQYMSELLREVFETEIVSHRAGRWGFNAAYAQCLAEERYLVDCSVTPSRDWSATKGDPDQRGGPDYRDFPCEPYFLNLNDISTRGTSDLLEAPMTVRTTRVTSPSSHATAGKVWSRVASRLRWRRRTAQRHRSIWLRPRRDNLPDLLELVDSLHQSDAPYAMFMLHSSELMPGGSPTFPDESSIEKLYADLEILFDRARRHFVGATLKAYRSSFPSNASGLQT
jgi:hypothetical protein